MANVKITDLPSGTIENSSDAFVFEGGQGTQQISYANLYSAILNSITSSNTQTVLLDKDAWQGVSAPYIQTVSATNITSEIVPEIAPSISDNVSDGLAEQTQWSCITKAVSGNGTITFKCYETKPTIDLTAIVKVV